MDSNHETQITLIGAEGEPCLECSDSSEVHVWRIPITQPESLLNPLWNSLAPEEQARANRFRPKKTRIQYIVSHGALRDVLSRYLGIAGGNVRFVHGEQGKPRVAGFAAPGAESGGAQAPSTTPPVSFSLSHSGDWALIAVAENPNVGIDVEAIRPLENFERLAERFFSSLETTALRAVPAQLRLDAFFTCWARKEAYLKARGDGLAPNRLNQFSVSLAPDAPPALLYAVGAPDAPKIWNLYDIDVENAYVAALAVQGPPPTSVVLRDWTGLSSDRAP